MSAVVFSRSPSTLVQPVATNLSQRRRAQASSLRLPGLPTSALLGLSAFLGAFPSAALASSSITPERKRASGLMASSSWFNFGVKTVASQNGSTAGEASGPDTDSPGEGLEFANFGAGCFWGVELAFQRIPGVLKTEVGYTQGTVDNPTYELVCSGRSGHVEAVRVVYDPKEVSYEALLLEFWKRHNPTQLNRQGNDVGTQYRSGIYVYSPQQEAIARASLEEQEAKIGRKIVTEILPAKKWYRAENYHQQYLSKGGRFGAGQSAAKGCNDPIRCYG